MFKLVGISVLLAMAALPTAAPAIAQTAAAIPQTKIQPINSCGGAEYRQLDFWVGEWRVFQTAGGAEVASSHIEHAMGDCGIKETYIAPGSPGGPYQGTSYSSYDRKDHKWRQMYIDTNGSVGWYVGELNGADMEMITPGPQGSLNRMIYRPQSDGSVRQIGTNSVDGGKTWQAGYDYTYRRK
jgi:hypothetical protein